MQPSSRPREIHSIVELFEQYYTVIYGYLLRLSGDPGIAEGLTAETFYRAMMALADFRGTASVKTWLIKIARNLYLNREKREKRTISLDALLEQGVAFPARQSQPEEALIKKQRLQAIQQALLSLAESDRSILLLTSQEKLSYREVGQVLEISVSAVKVRVFRARQRLAKALSEEK